MTVTGRSIVELRMALDGALPSQARCQLDFDERGAPQFSSSVGVSSDLLLPLLRGRVSLRVYRADDRLVRGILR
jgi:hypothetical protein